MGQPIDVIKMLKELGFTINVFYSDCEHCFQDCYYPQYCYYFNDKENVVAAISVNKEEKQIFVNRNNGYYTNRFISLYLFLLYNDQFPEKNEFYEMIYRESILDPTIYNLTVDILIPDELSSINNDSIRKVAQEYRVSPAVVMNKVLRKSKK